MRKTTTVAIRLITTLPWLMLYALLSSASAQEKEAFRGELDIKIPAQDLSLADVDGNEVQFADFEGRITVIGRGMSWCMGCPPEGQELSSLQRRFADQGVDFLYLDLGEPPNTALDFAKHCRMQFPVLLCTSYELPNSYCVGNPGIIIVDRQKNVRMRGYFYETGYGEELIGGAVERILKEQPAPGTRHESLPATCAVAEPQVLAESWAPATLVSTKGVPSYQPAVALSPNGGVWVAWVENIMESGEVAVRHYDGQEWLAVERPAPSEFDDYNPRVATDGSGNVWLVWVSNRNGSYAIWSSRFDGAGWQEPIMVSHSTGDCHHRSIAVDKSGRIWTAWYAWSSKRTWREKPYDWRSIYVTSRDGNRWAVPTEVTPFSDPCCDHWDPRIAVDRAGRPLVCWAKDNRNDPTIFSSSHNLGGWSEETIVSKPPKPQGRYHVPGRAFDFAPSLVACPDGTVTALWQSNVLRSWGGWQIKCAQRRNGHWSEPEQLNQGPGENCSPVGTISSHGTLAVFWTNLPGRDGQWNVCYAKRQDGRWRKQRTLVRGGNNLNPGCCVDESGKVWVVWQSGGEGSRSIYATREN